MKSSDFVVIGAGIIGLATARALRTKHKDATITVFEKESRPGLHASGRNSGVIHSGVYYPPGTLKSQLCVRGGELLKDFAAQTGAPMRKTGKVIIPTCEEDMPSLDRLMANAEAGGIRAVKMTADEIKRIEPLCQPHRAGIYIPDTAVVNAKAVMGKLTEQVTGSGIVLRLDERAVCADPEKPVLVTNRGSYGFGKLYNCAGAHADTVAHWFSVGEQYSLAPFKGIYRKVRQDRASRINHAIYPVPDLNFPFLGVHFTPSPGGDIFAGPTAIPALGRENYGLLSGLSAVETLKIGVTMANLYRTNNSNFRRLVHEELGRLGNANFLKAARRLVPSIERDDLMPSDKVGIRPQLVNMDEWKLVMDYVILRTDNSTHVLNAISPAFTSAFAFAEIITQDSGQ